MKELELEINGYDLDEAKFDLEKELELRKIKFYLNEKRSPQEPQKLSSLISLKIQNPFSDTGHF